MKGKSKRAQTIGARKTPGMFLFLLLEWHSPFSSDPDKVMVTDHSRNKVDNDMWLTVEFFPKFIAAMCT